MVRIIRSVIAEQAVNQTGLPVPPAMPMQIVRALGPCQVASIVRRICFIVHFGRLVAVSQTHAWSKCYLQAAQVRKCSYVAQEKAIQRSYHPETHHACTIHAGTTVQQACYRAPNAVVASSHPF